MLVGEVERMTRITVRRVLNIAAIAVVIALVFSLLGWAMMPQWSTRPYNNHIAVASSDPAIAPAHADIPHEGRYGTRETSCPLKQTMESRYRLSCGNRLMLLAIARPACSSMDPAPAGPRTSATLPTLWHPPVL